MTRSSPEERQAADSIRHTTISHTPCLLLSQCPVLPLPAGLVDKMAERAARRNMEDQTVGPVLTWTTQAMLEHARQLAALPGASMAFGGTPLQGHSIPPQYGAIAPTAVFVPLREMVKPENFGLATTEVFGPLQVRESHWLASCKLSFQ